MHRSLSPILILCASLCWELPAQNRFHRVSKGFDTSDAATGFPFPGFTKAFRQQLLIDASRLQGLVGKTISGLWLRRDLHDTDALAGGTIDLEVHLSHARNAAARASEDFAANAGTSPVRVLRGRVTVPNSPAVGTSPIPWSAANSIRIPFQTGFGYTGGTLCVDIAGRPVAGSEPDFWLLDYEDGSYDGGVVSIGRSCSAAATASGESLFANQFQLQIGTSLRLLGMGRHGATPMLLLGAQPFAGGIDLTPTGARDCRLYVDYLLAVPLRYATPRPAPYPAVVHFDTRIPADSNLLGTGLFVQFADDESALPATNRTNVAGLTTSNALRLDVSTQAPDLQMAIVTSDTVRITAPMPTRGRVDVSLGPVLRLLY